MLTLQEYLARVEARKMELGMLDTPETTEAMRNTGGSRTPQKRDLLKAVAARAQKAGREPVAANF